MLTVYDDENNCFHKGRNEAEIKAKVKRATDRRLQMITDGQWRKIVGARLSREEHQVLSDSERLGVPVTSREQLTGTEVPEPDAGVGTREWWEARVKSMKTLEAVQFADKHGLQFSHDAPNPGVLCMRARNAIYHWLRQGNLPSDRS